MAASLADQVDPGWYQALAPVESNIAEMGEFLRSEGKHDRSFLPRGVDILNAFTRPFADVLVLIVGQDPYPTPGHAMGLSFSVRPEVNPIPRSLDNIFRELTTDLVIDRPKNGDLSAWADRGVMLLNRVLTVEPGNPGSHRGKGWEVVTEQAIRAQRSSLCSAILRSSSQRTRARCPLVAGSLDRDRLAERMPSSSNRVRTQSTGHCERGLAPTQYVTICANVNYPSTMNWPLCPDH
jgi:uracil-DNA glycosylase